MPNVIIEISRDFGDCAGIERFRWDAYASEVEHAVREIVGAHADVKTVFVNFGASTVLVDGFRTEAQYHAIDGVFDLIDATDDGFYS